MISPEELATAKGRYGTVPQDLRYPRGNQFCGKVVDVTGDYVKFQRGNKYRDRWYHREHVTLHPVQA